MKQTESLRWLGVEDLAAKIDETLQLAEHLTILLREGNFSDQQLRHTPVFARAAYMQKTEYVCIGLLRTGKTVATDISNTDDIVVDGGHLGWVLTRNGLYRVEKLFGYGWQPGQRFTGAET
ncbi:hypothetical protein ABIB57_005303 [Devosia sp. UYZn731]|uniref:hypothetical protein n=1 Tax=Devosia sp. UYZn731 TaxID=3156345 RepID=UPI00339120FE